jgi:hypothetical protein
VTLNAISFVTEKSGWVVGDRGTILHSVTNGVTWERVPSPATEICLVSRSYRQRKAGSWARVERSGTRRTKV